MAIYMKHILIIFGTRPEAIKLAPVIQKLKENPADFKVSVCVTAQHRGMLDQVLGVFGIVPDHDLDIMRADQDLYDITSGVLLGLRKVLSDLRPDLVLVQGDTTTTMAAALAAFYMRIPVGHVEAGLRTGNKYAPFPEEVNRMVASRIADLHFAPTEDAKANLLREGVQSDKIYVTGNTAIDAVLGAAAKLRSDAKLRERIAAGFGFLARDKKILLVTGHRRENFGEGLRQFCLALKDISAKYEDVQIVYPVHLNPSVQKAVKELLSDSRGIFLLPPQEYLPFVYLMERAYFVLTDSGGLQEEAPALGKPVLVLRTVTERPEALAAGTIKLVGVEREKIFSAVSSLLASSGEYSAMAKAGNPYGTGDSAERIVGVMKELFQRRSIV